jgi:hypothetical protein
MSVELQSRIKAYAAWVESGQVPVTVEDVLGRSNETIPLARPVASTRRFSRGPWPALAAAAVVLVVFGVFLWVFPSDGPIPPADSLPPPIERELGRYTTSNVPDDFALQDIRTNGGSDLWYLNASDGAWSLGDGGFGVHDPIGHAAGLPEDPARYLDEVQAAVPGSLRVQIDGRPGVLYETSITQSDVSAPLIWILSTDGEGGLFEISAVGMNRDEVLDVADGVRRISVGEYNGLASQITWDVQVSITQGGSVPPMVSELADELQVVTGMSVLWPRLAQATEDTTVVTTDDGRVVEPGLDAVASSVSLFLTVSDHQIEETLEMFPGGAELSPAQRSARIEWFLAQLGGGEVLSAEPHVVQAEAGPEPRFDLAVVGEELPLQPAVSIDVLPESFFDDELFGARPAATEDLPVVVIGSVAQPDSDAPSVAGLLWFTDTGTPCLSAGDAESMGSGCGFELQTRFGVGGESNMGTYNHIHYEVPLDTSVVQIVTASQDYWQRPVAGFGLVNFGDTVGRPTTIIAYDADGNEIGRWPA